MKQVVWKYPLQVVDEQTVQVPLGATILHVDVQKGVPCLWVKVDPDAATTARKIITFPTGHEFGARRWGNLNHLGTYLLDDGAFVGHVFEEVMF